ncbi:MAG: substrate-binding domain-containing protein, partial [Planctomycetes bacterium]|nr:substrate-binding domain-containing protein [Planctomycetota bacterium]
MRRTFFVTSVLVASVLLAAGCAEARSGRLTVFASASLADAMQGVVTGFERAHPGLAVELHCAGTPHLLMQAHQGAAVDVFAAADRASMERFARSIALASP